MSICAHSNRFICTQLIIIIAPCPANLLVRTFDLQLPSEQQPILNIAVHASTTHTQPIVKLTFASAFIIQLEHEGHLHLLSRLILACNQHQVVTASPYIASTQPKHTITTQAFVNVE